MSTTEMFVRPGSVEWHAIRRTGIGGSDAAAILELNPYKTPLGVWLQKTGREEPGDAGEAAEWGNELESTVLRVFAKRSGLTVLGRDVNGFETVWTPDGAQDEAHPLIESHGDLLDTLRHAEHPELLANIDAVAFGPDGDWRFVEVKTSSAFRGDEWGEDGTDDVPTEYRVQVAHYHNVLASLGYEAPFTIVALIGGQKMRTYTCERDVELEARMTEKLLAWWDAHVVADEPPMATGADLGLLRGTLYPIGDDEEPIVLPEFADLNEDGLAWLDADRAEKYAKAAKDAAAARIQATLGTKTTIEGAGWRATWKNTKDTQSTDWKMVAYTLGKMVDTDTYNAAVAEATVTKLGSRRFLLKPRKEG